MDEIFEGGFGTVEIGEVELEKGEEPEKFHKKPLDEGINISLNLFSLAVLKISSLNWRKYVCDLKKTNFIEYFVLKPFSERR